MTARVITAAMRPGAAAAADGHPPLPVGQLYFPQWSDYEAAMRGIFERQYYTNHGPLVQQFEAQLQQRLEVRHAVCVTNATIGLLMAVEALRLRGRVIVPSFTFVATAQALSWTGLEPVFCDVSPDRHQLETATVEALIDSDVSAILAVNLWGDACDVAGLQRLADRHGIALFFDSAHAMGCRIDGRPIGGFGALEVFSFHATKVLGAAEGGCITTNDDELAARLRNIRSSYGAGRPVDVVRTANGRMSEAQAAIGLLELARLPQTIERNRELFECYRSGLHGIPGIALYRPSRVSATNHQYVVCSVDAGRCATDRDGLLAHLQAHGVVARRYFHPGIHRSPPYASTLPQFVDALPVTDDLNRRLIQLPIGALVGADDVARVCALVRSACSGTRRGA